MKKQRKNCVYMGDEIRNPKMLVVTLMINLIIINLLMMNLIINPQNK